MSDDDFNLRFSELQELERPKHDQAITDTSSRSFALQANTIISKWIDGHTTLSTEENQYLDILSNLELSFARYCLSIYNTEGKGQDIISKIRQRLFKTKQTDSLTNFVKFIRDNQEFDNEDTILIYIMRMLDARTLVYRLCYTELGPPPKNLNEELYACLNHKESKRCLDETISSNETTKKISTNRHRFFLGCCTFAVALFEDNINALTNNKDDDKYIYRLAKYVRIVLKQENFANNELTVYCLRGILALLTNCITTEYWLDIINKAFANKNDAEAQGNNPFNIDLFSSIINILLGSDVLRQNAMDNDSNDQALLVDIALVFLDKWCYTSENSNDDDDNLDTNNNNSSSSNISNQVVHFLRTDSRGDGKKDKTEIIFPYIDAKYDRIRLMAFSTLANVMSCEDLKTLGKSKPTMAKNLVKLIFDFIKKADESPNRQYKGVPFQRLLHYLLQFLVHDFIKEATTPYISKIVLYITQKELYALRILRKISSNPTLKSDLLDNEQLKEFLDKDADFLFSNNPKMKKIIVQIRQNLAPDEPKDFSAPALVNTGTRQAFISYCRDDRKYCDPVVEKIKQTNIFTKIWIDKTDMKTNVVDAITQGIGQSQVIFILLSDGYANSDACRSEWTFARKRKDIEIYLLIVQEEFKRNKYDWVVYYIEENVFYKVYKTDELGHMIEILREQKNTRPPPIQPQQETKATNNSNASNSIPTGNKEYLKKRFISEWAALDIREWCSDNNLKKWCELLNDYDGAALIELHRTLSIDAHLQHFMTIKNMNIIDVTLLKSKLDRLISTTTVTKKKDTKQRRTSKSSTK